MDTKLIELSDGTIVEVFAVPGEERPMAASAAEKVGGAMDKALPLLKTICKPIASVWQELNKEVAMDQAELELGLSFEGEGNLFVTKASMGANLKIKLVFKPKGDGHG